MGEHTSNPVRTYNVLRCSMIVQFAA